MQGVWRKVAELLRLSRLEGRWRKAARMLSFVVVFITTYMLILPAITMDDVTYCGLEEHKHNDSCHEIRQVLLCDNEDCSHGEACYIMQRFFICSLQEHLHQQSCLEKKTSTDAPPFIRRAYALEAGSSREAEGEQVKRVNYDTLDGTCGTYYLVYTIVNNRYYAFDGNGNAVEITLNSDGTVNCDKSDSNLFWSFTVTSGSEYRICNRGTGRYMHSYSNNGSGVTTSGNWTSTLLTTGTGENKTFRVRSNSTDYSYLSSSDTSKFMRTGSSSTASQYYLAQLVTPRLLYNVWLDGTCGGLMSLYQAGNVYQGIYENAQYIVLPESFTSPSKYDYVLKGWYDIKNNTYHQPGEKVTVSRDTVFYADWEAATYDIGQNNEHVVPSLDTDSFIRTDMFDYSAIFNMLSSSHSGTVSAASHSETWSVVKNGNAGYENGATLGFIFRDWDSSNKHLSYGANRDRLNDNQGAEITSEIIDYVAQRSDKDIIDVLFNPETETLGKSYIGKANYLYQFMDSSSSNYDGEHNGYYYYDATLNAASYNQSDERFYIYDYLERTSDSLKDGFDSSGNPTAAGSYSDFLPFNSPYVNNSNNKEIKDYKDRDGNEGNYQYDAKADGSGSAAGNAGTNYWFGMKSEIRFYLPNDTGTMDAYGNYGNISTHGEHMNFQFHGDDDLWVFVDGELVMDIGGLHGIMNGTIDFSTGIVTTDYAENNSGVATATQKRINFSEGEHTLTIYYMERGGSQSNCAIYFNISPRYAMEIVKQDALSGVLLEGAEFSVFTDRACTQPAQLWSSEADYHNNAESVNTFTVENGRAYFWGISPGKVYYIRETRAPEGYPEAVDIVRVAMNNLGGSVCTTDSLRGENNDRTDGFDILSSSSDEGEQLISVVLTNRLPKDSQREYTNIRVTKSWAEGSAGIPATVTVHLTDASGDMDLTAQLSAANDWTYTWWDMPLKDENGADISYSVWEEQTEGFYGEITRIEQFEDNTHWMKTDALRDGDSFIICNSSNQALSVSSGSFRWISFEAAQTQTGAWWTANAEGMGFHLENADGYRIILDGTSSFIPDINGNRILYFYDSVLFAQNGNVYYYFSDNAAASSQGGMTLSLYKNVGENVRGTLYELTNIPIDEQNTTSLTVTKQWEDGATAHINDSITVKLYADGRDTGRTVVLNRANGWQASFTGLNYQNGDAVISYSVKELPFPGYIPEYSVLTEVEGGVYTGWDNAQSLESGKIYRFCTGSSALASNSSNSVVFAASDEENKYQQWQVVSYNGNLKLRNVQTGRYLYYSSSLTTNTRYTNNYSNVTLASGRLTIGSSTSRYIYMNNSGNASTTTSSGSATVFTVTVATEKTKPPSYEMRVNNIKAGYVLPETGGRGKEAYQTVAVLLMAVPALICAKKIWNKEKKHRKGEC